MNKRNYSVLQNLNNIKNNNEIIIKYINEIINNNQIFDIYKYPNDKFYQDSEGLYIGELENNNNKKEEELFIILHMIIEKNMKEIGIII